MKRSLLTIFFLAVAVTTVQAQSSPLREPKSDVIHQLRVYEIFDNTRTAFHARFKDHAMRIMKRYDFKIVGIWENRSADKLEFVYLLEWKDEATMNAKWKSFLADQEWIDIKKRTNSDTAPLIGNI
ncbi:MAG TPA: NIPSNAP family protein, partial [Pyrinomonadaceae bacterium]|nr:NIPSNAP family protein [Pyrinomonadaceae bacterium]